MSLISLNCSSSDGSGRAGSVQCFRRQLSEHAAVVLYVAGTARLLDVLNRGLYVEAGNNLDAVPEFVHYVIFNCSLAEVNGLPG